MDRTNSDDVYTMTQGVPGQRELIVQFNDVVIYYNNNAAQTLTFQVVLREGNNEIEFRYNDATLSSATYSLGRSATIGISDGTGDRFEQFSYNTASLADDTRIVFSGFSTPASQSLTFSVAATDDGTYRGAGRLFNRAGQSDKLLSDGNIR